MVELISFLIAFGIVFDIPNLLSKKEEGKRLEDLYSPKSNDHSTDEWKM